MDSDTLETISFLVRSGSRVRVLERLFEAGPATRRDLGTDLDFSRSTIVRSLNALEERNWVERRGREYHLTPVGDLVVDAFLDLAETVRTTEDLSTFAAWFPFSEFDLEIEHLRDADVTASGSGDPYAPSRTQTDLLQTATRFRGFLPSIDVEGTRLVHERITAGELEAEIVVSPDVERAIRTGEFEPLHREMAETGRLTVAVCEEGLPFYLGIADGGTVQIGVEDDEGFPRALAESSGDPLEAWAEDVYREYRRRAEPVDGYGPRDDSG